jgi:ketosteroid isomerase-like protein/uncharacterized protein YciI
MRAILAVAVLMTSTLPLRAEVKEYLYILEAVRPEMVTAGPNDAENVILAEHGRYLDRLTREGTLILAGRTQEANSMGLAIFRAASDEDARSIMNGDPAVARGIMKATLHPYKVAFHGSGERPADRKEIEELHRRDEEASKKGDYATLRSLLSENMVMLAPGQKPVPGRERMTKMEALMKDVKILQYDLAFDEVEIAGDYAFEWGTISGSSQLPDGSVTKAELNVMRILRRDSSGRWKVHRSIWNAR